MKIACVTVCASLRGALIMTALASIAGAQNQTGIRQFGTTNDERVHAAAPDGVGGLFVSGYTQGSLGGPSAGSGDAWLAHYDSLVATRYCTPAIPNSTGAPGALTAIGSNTVAANNFTLGASLLSQRAFGFFLHR